MATASQPRTNIAVRQDPHFDVDVAAESMHSALLGKTNKRAVIDQLCSRNAEQRAALREHYKTKYGRDLIEDTQNELGGSLEDTVVAMLKTPAEFDAWVMHGAVGMVNTDENALIEVMATRNRDQLLKDRDAYNRMYGRDLVKDVESGTSGHFRSLLVGLLLGQRDTENKTLDRNKAERDADRLAKAAEEDRWFADKSVFNDVFMNSSNAQLRAVNEEFRKISEYDLQGLINEELSNVASGDVKVGYLALLQAAYNPAGLFADRLHQATGTLMTDKLALIRIIVGRSEIDLDEIKREYRDRYNRSLESAVEEYTSGDFQRVLLSMLK